MVPGTGGGWDCLMLTTAAALTQLMWLPGCCGSYIVGGHEVMPHSRPYMASVSFEGRHHCGGFLFHAHWVASAAHCFSDRDPSTGLVVLGAHELLTREPTQQVFSIAAAVSHPDFQPSTQANDICLLRLNGSAILGPAVRLLRLPRRGAKPPMVGMRCRVSGWGFVSDFEEPPPGLMEVEADSGGPLVCGRRAHGLVSFSGLWCGDPKTPDVYTQVSAFVTWIWDVVRASSSPGSMGRSVRGV
ncbi:serine protease 57 isoform X4 [Arvicanthis niloticus]|uniref:serine protease 57 isoform X4 n=1 Tax=Arvicanthis niloticus TaxID=61156 RepID=UPI00402B8B6B